MSDGAARGDAGADGERRVPLPEVSDLIAPGEPLPFRVLDALGRLLLAEGHRIADGRQLATLLERGACVVWSEAQAVRAARAGAAAPGRPEAAVRTLTLFDRWESAIGTHDALLRRLGRDPGQAAELDAAVDEHVARVDRDPDVALFLAVRQDDRRFSLYSVTHALHVATAVLLAARLLGWSPAQQRQAVGAALTMNAAIVELQSRLAEQPDPPSRKQLDELRAHPTQSAALLRASGIADEGWLAAVQDHHEREGGSGYPRGVAEAGEIGELAQLLRAADVFMAKLSPRALRAALLPQQAAQQLFRDAGGGPLAASLIKAIGITPPGEFVSLKNGEAGIVVRRAAPGGAPLARALRDARGRPLAGAPVRDGTQPEQAIAGPLPDRSGLPRVLPESVYGLLLP